MTPALWVAVGGVVVSAIVALIVAGLQRRQMRQIELHREDPSISLTPPPHPAIAWLFEYGPSIGVILYDFYRIGGLLQQTGPITRDDVFHTAAYFFSIALQSGFILFFYVMNRMRRMMGSLVDSETKVIEILRMHQNAIIRLDQNRAEQR